MPNYICHPNTYDSQGVTDINSCNNCLKIYPKDMVNSLNVDCLSWNSALLSFTYQGKIILDYKNLDYLLTAIKEAKNKPNVD